jgi:hypothetical protein
MVVRKQHKSQTCRKGVLVIAAIALIIAEIIAVANGGSI